MPRPKPSDWRRAARALGSGNYHGDRFYTDALCAEILSAIPSLTRLDVGAWALRRLVLDLEWELLGDRRPTAGSKRAALAALGKAMAAAGAALAALDDDTRHEFDLAAGRDDEHAADLPSYLFAGHPGVKVGDQFVELQPNADRGYLRVQSDREALDRLTRWAKVAESLIPQSDGHLGGNPKLWAERMAVEKLRIIWKVLSYNAKMSDQAFVAFAKSAIKPILKAHGRDPELTSVVRDVVEQASSWDGAEAYHDDLKRRRDRTSER